MIRITIDCESLTVARDYIEQLTGRVTQVAVVSPDKEIVIENAVVVPAVAEATPKKQHGGRRTKKAPEAAQPPLNVAPETKDAQPQAAAPAPAAAPQAPAATPNKDDDAKRAIAQELVGRVFADKGFETAVALLARFGVERLSMLLPTQLTEFNATAQLVLDGALNPITGAKA